MVQGNRSLLREPLDQGASVENQKEVFKNGDFGEEESFSMLTDIARQHKREKDTQDQLAPELVIKDDGKIKPSFIEIKRYRKLSGISQERLSDLTGISLKTIRNLESNPNYSCRAGTLAALAAFFKLEPSALVQQPAKGKTLRLLTSAHEIIAANTEIARSAQKYLLCVGSRARDEQYLRTSSTEWSP